MMNRSVVVGIIVCVMVLMAVLGGFLVWHGDPNGGDVLEGWGQGSMSPVESAYYARRFKRIVDFWQEASDWTAKWKKGGRIEQPNDVFLVIDVKKSAMWVEYKGQAVKELYSELPEGMEWSVHHLTPDGSQELSKIVRLQVRGVYTSRLFAEMIYLAGTGRGWNMNFQIKSHTSGMGQSSSAQMVIPKYNGKKPKHEDPYKSIIVNEKEYSAYLAALENRDKEDIQEGIDELLFHGSDVFRGNVKKWQAIEKRLYAEMAKRFWDAGYGLRSMSVTAGPDYRAGSAELKGVNDGLFGSKAGYINFAIDYLGEGVWYVGCQTVGYSGGEKDINKLTWLIPESGTIAREDYDKWLKKGEKARIDQLTKPSSKWQATLDNGVVVAFIGLCENPSGGKVWFGPDGKELDFVPYSNYKRYGKKGDKRKIYEFAWRVHWPRGGRGGSTGSMEGSQGSYGRMNYDKYGYSIIEGLQTEGYIFKEGQEKATLKLGYKMGQADYSRLRFENISLVCGKDFGFKMVVEEKDSGDAGEN